MSPSEKKGFSGDFNGGTEVQFEGAHFNGAIAATKNYLVCYETSETEFWILSFKLDKIGTFGIDEMKYVNGSNRMVMKYNEWNDTLLVFIGKKIYNINLESKTVLWSTLLSISSSSPYATNCVGIEIDSRGIIYVGMTRGCPAILYVLAHNGEIVERVGKECSKRVIDVENIYGIGMDGEENIVINASPMMKLSRMLKRIKIPFVQLLMTQNPMIYDSVKDHFLISGHYGIKVYDMKFNVVAENTLERSPFSVTLSNNGVVYQICTSGSSYNKIKSFQ